jgi:predicted nucleotidyltransferase
MAYDPLGALRTLQEHGVRFIVIGGVAGRLWGSPTMTNDVDICYARDQSNLERLAEALLELEARLRGVDDDVPFKLDATTLANGQNFTFMTKDGPLDVLGMPSGVNGFDELITNVVEFDLGDGLVLQVCDLDDLIRMKRAAGRAKDRIELEVLAAVREERSESDL